MAHAMTSTNQAKGARAETTVAAALRSYGFLGAERARVKHPDRGDISGLTEWTVEVKNIGREVLAESMDQLRMAQLLNAGTPWGVLVKQRRNYPVARWFAVMEFDQWARMAASLDRQSAAERSA
jgi:hypothetical protein